MTRDKVAVLLVAASAVVGCDRAAAERAGRDMFFDTQLSVNANQSCAACHALEAGGTGGEEALNAAGAVYEGSYPDRFGNRKPPTSAYSFLAPRFTYDAKSGFRGGVFWDGRASGWKLGIAAADQAQGPFLNPVEQALRTPDDVVQRVCSASYARTLQRAFGPKTCRDTQTTWNDVAYGIAAWEGGPESSPFSSKLDAWRAGKARLDAEEAAGLALFTGKAKCAHCHSADPATAEIDHASTWPPAFTDFHFANTGVPKNPDNPFYRMDKVLVDGKPINPLGAAWVDVGLAGFVSQLAADDAWRSLPFVTEPLAAMTAGELAARVGSSRGRFRVPTLRNVNKRPSPEFVKAYGHNGYFKSLPSLVHFYNTRDVLPRCAGALREADALAAGCWPAPEVPDNVEHDDVGDLGLTPAEERAIVAFLGTLSDGFTPHGH